MTRPARSTAGHPRTFTAAGLMALLPMASLAQSLPQAARPGDCFARIAQPPVFEQQTERIEVAEASERVEVTPAEYEWTEETIVVRPDRKSTRLNSSHPSRSRMPSSA